MRRSNKNRVYLTGLVMEGPDLDVEDGAAVLHMKVRSRRFRMKAGEEVEYFDLLDVDMHGANAERAAECVKTHTVVEVLGRLEARKRPVKADGRFVYEHTKKGKQKVTYWAVTIVASRIQPLSSPSTAEEASPDEGRAADDQSSEALEIQAQAS